MLDLLSDTEIVDKNITGQANNEWSNALIHCNGEEKVNGF